MKQLYPDLWQTAQQKQFSILNVHAYLLKRQNGNVLFYNPRSTEDFQHIGDLGGISYQYLSHCHEVHNSLGNVTKHFNSKLCCHARVKPYFDEMNAADIYFNPSGSEFHSDNIEVINTPGHTDNNLCFRYRSAYGKTYLFTGDTIYLDNGIWNTVIVQSDGGNNIELMKSLRRLRGLSVDVVICSVSVGEYRIVEVTQTEWQAIIDNLLDY